MKRFIPAIAFVLFAISYRLEARAQADAHGPAPELSKLSYLVGAWHVEGNERSETRGSTKMTGTEENSWMEGRCFLVMRLSFTSTSGGGYSSVGYMGYDKDAGVYTYDEFTSAGGRDHSKGVIEGDTWTWSNEGRRNGHTYKGRFVMKIVSSMSYSYKYEVSPDGTSWTTMAEGTASRAK